MELRRAAERAWTAMDVLVTPTAGTIYRIDAVESEPIRLNSNLGYYTNFVNLLDLAAVAVPAGFRDDGLPFGVTLVGRAGTDARLLAFADRLHRAADVPLGALSIAIPPLPASGAAVHINSGPASPTARQWPRNVFRCQHHMAVEHAKRRNHARHPRRAQYLRRAQYA